MSGLYPGGKRNSGGQVFGAGAIKAACQRGLKARDHREEAATSIADQEHSGSREQQRRLRQAERKARK